MSTPVLLLDVDGVINIDRSRWDTPLAAGRATIGFGPYAATFTIRWAPQVARWLRNHVTAGDVDVRWCTTWCPHAGEIERLLELPPLTRALEMDPVPAGSAGDRAKLAAALEIAESGHRLVWIDDTAIPRDNGPNHVAHGKLLVAGALLIRPNARTGVGPAHLELVDWFIRGEYELHGATV